MVTVIVQCKIFDFDIGKKQFEGLLVIFFWCKRFESVTTVRINVPKNFKFFFHMLFWGSTKPSYNKNTPSRSPKTWYLTHFRVLIRMPY